MKKLIYIICIAFLTMSLNSCDWLHSFGEATGSSNAPDAELYEEESDEGSSSTKTDTVNKDDQKSSLVDETKTLISNVKTDLNKQRTDLDSVKTELTSVSSASEDKMDRKSAYAFMIIEAMILLGLIAYLFHRISEINRRMSSYNDRLVDIKTSMPKEVHNQPYYSTSSSNRDLKDLKTKVNTLESKISGLECKMRDHQTTSTVTPVVEESSDNQNNLQPQHDNKSTTNTTKDNKVFYMPRSPRANQFDDRQKTFSPNESTYFKFTLLSKEEAEFEFFGGDDTRKVRDSYNDRNDSIATVCDIVGTTADPQKCVTKVKGKAKLVNGTWYVNPKAKIAYV